MAEKMELNFDKEMDALLRQTARRGEIVSMTSPQAHLDADEIAAFAESALPEKARAAYVHHFAGCDRCRRILSNTILLNAEAEAETASSVVPAAAPAPAGTIETAVPWYRRIFLMPNLAYTMGALVLAVGGMLGFMVFQNATGSFDMAKDTSANRATANAPAAPEERSAPLGASNAATAANMANTTANAAVSSATNSAANANSSILSVPADGAPTPLSTPPAAESDDRARDQKPQKKAADEGFQVDGASNSENTFVVDGQETRSITAQKPADRNENKAETAEKQPSVTADSARPSAAAPPPPPAKDDARAAELSKTRRATKLEATTKQIGGKTFNLKNGVWIDAAYDRSGGSNLGLPPTRTIRRGSDEYRKLDRQVRIIAESLAGPVIVVWKDGAYRIQ